MNQRTVADETVGRCCCVSFLVFSACVSLDPFGRTWIYSSEKKRAFLSAFLKLQLFPSFPSFFGRRSSECPSVWSWRHSSSSSSASSRVNIGTHVRYSWLWECLKRDYHHSATTGIVFSLSSFAMRGTAKAPTDWKGSRPDQKALDGCSSHTHSIPKFLLVREEVPVGVRVEGGRVEPRSFSMGCV